MWSVDDIVKLDERIRETKRQLASMQAQRAKMMHDRMQFKKLIQRGRRRRQTELKNDVQTSKL